MRKHNEKERYDVNAQDGLALASSSASSYLGNPNVVETIVRDFFVSVFSARAKFNEGGNGGDAEAKINNACKKHAAIFYGEDPEYTAQPWNNPHRLGNYLRAIVPDVQDFDTPAESYFQYLAVQAINASLALESGQADEDSVKAELNGVVEDAIAVLMGMKKGSQL